MKQLSGILLVLLVAVGFVTVPTSYAYGCSHEAEEQVADQKQESAAKSKTHENTSHHTAAKDTHKDHSCPIGGCGDDCNCGCACVHSQTSIFTNFSIKSFIPTFLLEEKLPEVDGNLTLQSYHTDIWQPPKC